ncbi:O-acyltransferase [Streptomyces ambofaciens ATCC 23877]|uniref:O-acyltransferase n=2 Tax=Streptomyces ambofaciens TaxID=1889 RepID=A0A0K2AZX6_STRA7|nr:acyltransferase [Streptomyces ambofaciens]AKZ58680.1 O-acyltransferase [Streptomyces ambofaciens ATCC 23877]CAM96572.1 O-acyltransferase [Streptomyces ambofaciens ATCC 23877]
MLQRVDLSSLTGLRWYAALTVFACHIAQQGFFADQQVGSALLHITPLGSMAVSIFFILSGFVLAWSARDEDSVPTFWRRRIAKIYPLHLATFGIAALIIFSLSEPVLPGGSVWDGLVPNVLLVQSWLPDATLTASFNTPSWSLSCEIAFYLSFPLWYRLVRRIPARRLWWCAAGIAVAVTCVPLLAGLLPASEEVAPGMSLNEVWFAYWLPPVRMLEFVLGIVMALILRAGIWKGPGPAVCTALLAASYGLTQMVPPIFTLVACSVVPAALLITALADADVHGRRTGLRSATLVRLGQWSFAFYLVHFLIIRYGHRLMGGDLGYERQWSTPAAIALSLGMLGVAVLAGGLLHTVVEQPCMRLFGSRRSASRPKPGATAAPRNSPAADAAGVPLLPGVPGPAHTPAATNEPTPRG